MPFYPYDYRLFLVTSLLYPYIIDYFFLYYLFLFDYLPLSYPILFFVGWKKGGDRKFTLKQIYWKHEYAEHLEHLTSIIGTLRTLNTYCTIRYMD